MDRKQLICVVLLLIPFTGCVSREDAAIKRVILADKQIWTEIKRDLPEELSKQDRVSMLRSYAERSAEVCLDDCPEDFSEAYAELRARTQTFATELAASPSRLTTMIQAFVNGFAGLPIDKKDEQFEELEAARVGLVLAAEKLDAILLRRKIKIRPTIAIDD